MCDELFPVIDPEATGRNILRLRKARGLTVRDVQEYFRFGEPRVIYKWQKGQCLPTVDNLYALSRLLQVSMNEILVSRQEDASAGLRDHPAASFFCCFFLTSPPWASILGSEKPKASAQTAPLIKGGSFS